MITVNGKQYPMWSQFVEKKSEWIGGTLCDNGDPIDRVVLGDGIEAVTEITNITLEPNGDTSAYFLVVGKEFSCGFDVRYGGISGKQKGSNWLTFNGYGGHAWHIKKRGE